MCVGVIACLSIWLIHIQERVESLQAGKSKSMAIKAHTQARTHAHTQTTHTPHTTALTRGQARWKRMWIWVYAEIVWAQALAICYHCLCAVLAVEMENWIRNTKLNFRLWNGRAARKFDIIVPNVDDIERRKLLQRSDTTQKVDTAALRAGNKIWEIFRGQSLICGWQLIPGRAPRGNYSYRFPSDTINKHRVYAALAQAQFINCHASPRWLTWPSWAFLFLLKNGSIFPSSSSSRSCSALGQDVDVAAVCPCKDNCAAGPRLLVPHSSATSVWIWFSFFPPSPFWAAKAWQWTRLSLALTRSQFRAAFKCQLVGPATSHPAEDRN